MTGPQPLWHALWRLYQHSGFAMAGAVAFSFIVSIFPFCIFMGALAGVFGGRELANQAIAQLFLVLPKEVAEGLAPQVDAIMGRTRIDLLTYGGALALFFATSAIETLRAALNQAYRVTENRYYPTCLLLSMIFVLVSAVSTLVLTWAVVVGPTVAARFEPSWLKDLLDSTHITVTMRYGLAAAVIAAQLLAIHLWLAAGRRTLEDVWPGVLLSIVLWLALAWAYSFYLDYSDYTRFYAGLSQLMVAMIFFQLTAVVILLGAELNRGLMELRRLGYVGDDDDAQERAT
ncbi:MAG: YihY/virulence factor BrkB family protein [Hyphomicrobiaceae bacterium]|jgi:membrane protein